MPLPFIQRLRGWEPAGFRLTCVITFVMVAVAGVAIADSHAPSLTSAETSSTQGPLTDDPPWWRLEVHEPMRRGVDALPIGLESLVVRTLTHSAQIRVFSDLPLIRETSIVEADAAFDWTAYWETLWDQVSEPVGSLLQTGGPPRFRDEHWTFDGGFRRKNYYGGELEFGQQLGHQDTNSRFFVPRDQGTARLTLSYTQPLLRGRGVPYNTSLTVLASIDTDIAYDEYSRQLQSHLLEVTRAYWGLYLERGTFAQKQRLFRETKAILDELEARQALDTYQSQIIRARAAVEARGTDLVRAEMAIKNAEARIRALSNDPQLGTAESLELVPLDIPSELFIPVSLPDSLTTALQLRPEIRQAMKQIRAAAVRTNMSKHELLPILNVVAQTYVSGLRGSSDIGGAWVDQFSVGEPSYSFGLQYELALCNRAAKARYQRRRIEYRQIQNQFRSTTETLKLEVEVAVREVTTSYRELRSAARSMRAAAVDLDYIDTRWRHLPGEDNNASLVFDELLRAQERLTDAESEFLRAQMTYNLSLTNLKRATGELLQSEHIDTLRACECGLPRLVPDIVHPSSESGMPGEHVHPVPEVEDIPAGAADPPLSP